MDESLRRAARAGNVSELYSLIREDGNILRRIEEVEFIDTPLHIAAEEGCIDFAMEIMSLKPSFARKLNPDGLSPLHLAVKKGHKEIVLRFLEVDKDLIRVKGKKAKTPLHYVSKQGNSDGMLDRFLEAYPECIQDVTTKNQTALHIAVKHNQLDVLQVLTRMLSKKNYRREVVNRKDKDGNTALHIAAMNNQPQMIKLLLRCKADKHMTNQDGSKALDVARQLNKKESISILHDCFSPRVSAFQYKLKKQIGNYVTKASSVIFHDMDSISSEDRNALLVILALLLTSTFQATLSPPGGVWQQGEQISSNSFSFQEKSHGKSGLDQAAYLAFYIPTCVVFMVTFFLTLGLLKPFPSGYRTALEVVLAFFAICFGNSITFIAPTYKAMIVIGIYSVLVFVLMMFMCIAYRVSRISVTILGYSLLPAAPSYFANNISDGNIFLGYLILGCWLFLFLYDDIWKGSIVSLVYTILCLGYIILLDNRKLFVESFIVPGCWLFLSLCRFFIGWCRKRLLQYLKMDA